ncbi:MAG: hypothetical protein KDD62_14765, partial [Bdellovibrionales bacterium]|nr:hypothetical protein [Bdellovibrionales bacterium]
MSQASLDQTKSMSVTDLSLPNRPSLPAPSPAITSWILSHKATAAVTLTLLSFASGAGILNSFAKSSGEGSAAAAAVETKDPDSETALPELAMPSESTNFDSPTELANLAFQTNDDPLETNNGDTYLTSATPRVLAATNLIGDQIAASQSFYYVPQDLDSFMHFQGGAMMENGIQRTLQSKSFHDLMIENLVVKSYANACIVAGDPDKKQGFGDLTQLNQQLLKACFSPRDSFENLRIHRGFQVNHYDVDSERANSAQDAQTYQLAWETVRNGFLEIEPSISSFEDVREIVIEIANDPYLGDTLSKRTGFWHHSFVDH